MVKPCRIQLRVDLLCAAAVYCRMIVLSFQIYRRIYSRKRFDVHFDVQAEVLLTPNDRLLLIRGAMMNWSAPAWSVAVQL